MSKINQDHKRFLDIVKGKIKSDLRKYVSSKDFVTRSDGKGVRVPMPQIQLPKFTYDDGSGIGSGEGKIGDKVGSKGKNPGVGSPGKEEADHELEVTIPLEELADILGEGLALPRIEPKGLHQNSVEKYQYDSISRNGAEGLRHFKRTFKAALLRSIATGEYDPDNPIVVPIKEDRRYKSFSVQRRPIFGAAIIYMMDVSGSMSDAHKDIVRTTAFWLDTWLKRQYQALSRVFIIHHVKATEVDENAFYHTKENGGTASSSAYELCLDIIKKRFPVEDWNIYPFHFSDGDNFSWDNDAALKGALELSSICNQFSYGEVNLENSGYPYHNRLSKVFNEGIISNNLNVYSIEHRDQILEMIRAFLSKGK